MEIKVEKINVSKSYDRNKIYTPEDITDEVIMPIIDVERLDTTLDTSSITLLNSDKKPIVPFTRMKITITNNDGTQEKIYRLVYTDNVEKLNFTTNERYKHYIELIEPTKWLERFEVDNTTITNYLAWLYHEGEGVIIEEASAEEISKTNIGMYVDGVVFFQDPYWLDSGYSGDTRIQNYYLIGSQSMVNVRLQPKLCYAMYFIVPIGTATLNANLVSYTITTPGGNVLDATGYTNYTFNELGTYVFEQKYQATTLLEVDGVMTQIVCGEVVYRWTSKCVLGQAEVSQPGRHTIRQVCDNILNRIGDDASTIRTGIELPMFQLDGTIASKLDTLISPEFTFTQNTLFGVLSQIGNEIHAIPRLKPTIININNQDGTITEDDYSSWTTITFDFLGGSTPTNDGQEIGYENTQNGDNYATSFVSNIENSFQTNNADYVSLTEPYTNGYVSTRTEDASFEVSNNSACIKTSRPIQRIVSLEVLYDDNKTANITAFVKEATDYSILLDYPETQTEFVGYSTKSTAIYYTRGENVIRGLDYIPPDRYMYQGLTKAQAIIYIISLASGVSVTNMSSVKLKDLMFRIKYIPFYNLKAKQFKQYIDENSGDNELFYNQVNTQSVDIESLGENIKGALLRTANEEPTITSVFRDASNMIHAGQINEGGYYAYEVNKQITNTQIKATTKFSKDWNKLNEYVAIKKNYREWEISERESIETTPCYNEFCVLSDELDFDKGNIVPNETEKQNYINQLKEYGGFLSTNSIRQIYSRLANSSSAPEESTTFTSDDYFSVVWAPGDYGFYVDDITDADGLVYNLNEILYYEDEQYTINYISLLNNYFKITVPSNSKLYQAINNGEDVTLTPYTAVQMRPIEWTVATCKTTNYIVYTSQTALDENNDEVTTILCGETDINKDYTTFTTTDEYVDFYILDANNDNNATKVTIANKDNLGIVPGSTPCYYSLPIIYTVTYSNDDPPLLILTDSVNGVSYQASSTTAITVAGIDYMIGEKSGEIVLTKTTTDTFSKTFLLPTSCCSFGNSILINFGAVDNYSAGTYSVDKTGEYALEQYIPYSNKYGNIETMELRFGSGLAKRNGFSNYTNAKNTSKELYTFDIARLVNKNVILDYSKHSFLINKDSRQALNFTNQLHFVSDTQKIWIGKALAQSMPFCGNTESNILKYVYFTQKPDKFCQTRDNSIWTEVAMPTCTVDYDLKYIKYDKKQLPADAVGFGLVDNQNRIVLYYNKEIKANEYTEEIYFQFRRKI